MIPIMTRAMPEKNVGSSKDRAGSEYGGQPLAGQYVDSMKAMMLSKQTKISKIPRIMSAIPKV